LCAANKNQTFFSLPPTLFAWAQAFVFLLFCFVSFLSVGEWSVFCVVLVRY
jgi:hypothetical protein